MKNTLIILFLISINLINAQTWKYKTGENPFDGKYKTAFVTGNATDYPYTKPILAVNLFNNNKSFNFYISNSGYYSNEEIQILWSFDNNKNGIIKTIELSISEDGKNQLIQDIALITLDNGQINTAITGKIPKGKYIAISFDLGVREDLNLKDPATYTNDHPLSVMNNMYWGWSTQYIFSKFEGFEVLGNDTNSFVIHTGTQPLYRPNIQVQRIFEVISGGTEESINLDIFSILTNSEYTFDLSKDGQSHTVDNLPLAIKYMDNFTVGFN